jgi:voltage-gated potassium channel
VKDGQPPLMPRRIEKVLTSRHVVLRLILTISIVVVGLGILMALLDRKDFPSVWLAIWWAVGTVSTVGYGDVVPVQLAGRIVASVAMIAGIGFISILTATVASSLVATRDSQTPQGDDELLASISRVEQRLAELEQSIRALRS